MWASGRKTRWMEREYFTIPTTASHMMASGNRISFKAEVRFTMKKLCSSIFLLISRIGKMLMSIGSNTKDNSWRIAKMAWENFFFRMVRFFREISRMIQYGVKDA